MSPTHSTTELTARQSNILDFLAKFLDDHGYPPTVRETGAFFGIKSTNGVSDHLRALERKGYISRSDGQSRGLTILKGADGRVSTRRAPLGAGSDASNTDSFIDVPILGRVAAGVPLMAVRNIDDHLRIDPAMVQGRRDVFGLRVAGDSMIEAGILDGDLVFVHERPTADNGQIVIAMIDEEVTVKRYFRELSGIRLQPENRSMKPIFIDRDDPDGCTIVGEVVGVFRQLG
jgi:repressor LexA